MVRDQLRGPHVSRFDSVRSHCSPRWIPRFDSAHSRLASADDIVSDNVISISVIYFQPVSRSIL
jgi:hypothetical protein